MATTVQRSRLPEQIGLLLEMLELSGEKHAVKTALRQFSQATGLKRFAYVGVGSDAVRTLTDLPEDWEKRYHEDQFATVDPVVERAKRTLKPFCWSYSRMEIADTATRRFCEQIGEVGVASGMTIPMEVGFGRTAMLTFMTDTRSGPLYTSGALQKAIAAVAYTHLYMSQPAITAPRGLGHSLTPKERAFVVWTSLGKQEHEIAQVFGLSEQNVSLHLASAKEKLRAENAPHMVRRAFEARIIDHS